MILDTLHNRAEADFTIFPRGAVVGFRNLQIGSQITVLIRFSRNLVG